MSVQRISSFKSFTEVKNQQASIKMHEENKTKRDQLLAKIGQTLEEMGVTSLEELDEEKRTALVAKIFNEDRAEDIEAAKVKMGEPKKHEDEEGKAVQSTNESLVTEATRSQIGKIDKAGKITSVYVHWDGSPDTRVPLLKHYKDTKKLNKLLDLGKQGISSLEKEIGDKPQDFNKPDRGITVFYGRDRNEMDHEDMTMKSDVKSIQKYLKDAGNHSSAEFVYLFDERDGKWYMADVYDDKELKPVKESVEVNEADKPKVGDELTMVKNGKKGKVVKCGADQCDVDFGSGDVYGIVYRRIKGDKIEEAVEINEDIDIHDKLSDLMAKLQVQIGNLLHTAKGNSDWTRELNAIKKAFETLEDRMTIASKKLGMLPESVEINEALSSEQKMVETFLKKIAKEFDYSIGDAAKFVKDTISKMGLNESFINEAMFGSKDLDKTLVTYAIDKKADEIYIVSVDKVVHSSFPDVSKVEDKRFRIGFGMMLEQDWLKQYDKLPKVGDILPAPKKDKAFESTEINEADKPAGLTKDETMVIAQKFADAIAKVDGKKVTVNKKTLEEDSFDLDIDGEEFDGGSYMIFRNGNVRNAALPKNPIYGKTTDSVDTIVKNLKSLKESVELNEGFEVHYSDGIRAMKKFGMQSQAMAFAKDLIKNKKGLQFVDVFNAGSNFHSTSDTNAIVAFWGDGSYTDNVSKKDPKLAAKKIEESIELNEARSINKIQNEWTKVTAEMKSTVDSWKKAEGDAKAPLLAKLKELTAKKNALESELNDAISDKDKDLELVVSEGNAFVYAAAKAKQEGKKEFEFNGKTYKVTISDTSLSEEVEVIEEAETATEINEEDITSDEQFKEYAFKVLKQAFEADFDEAKAQEVVDGILKVAKGNYGEAVGMLTSSLG